MPSNKNQHFVPQLLLRNFSSDSSKSKNSINTYILKNKKFIENVSIKSQCSKDYFYGKNLIMEKKLQVYERNVNPEFKKIIDNDYNEISKEKILYFLIIQLLRTESILNQSEISKESFYNFFKEKLEIQDMKNYLFSNEIYMEMMLEEIKKWYSILEKLKFKIIKNKTKIDFLISDNPVIAYNPFRKTLNGGFREKGQIFLLPISPKDMIIFYDSEIYKEKINTDILLIIEDAKEIRKINELQYIVSNNNLFFASNKSIKIINEIVKKILEDKRGFLRDAVLKSNYSYIYAKTYRRKFYDIKLKILTIKSSKQKIKREIEKIYNSILPKELKSKGAHFEIPLFTDKTLEENLEKVKSGFIVREKWWDLEKLEEILKK